MRRCEGQRIATGEWIQLTSLLEELGAVTQVGHLAALVVDTRAATMPARTRPWDTATVAGERISPRESTMVMAATEGI